MTTVKTGAYTAVANNLVPCNTNASAFTLTLPASPAAGTSVGVFDYFGTFSTNNLTVARNGQDIMNLAEDMALDVDYLSVEFKYVDATVGWIMV